jgi:hypothetical protein
LKEKSHTKIFFDTNSGQDIIEKCFVGIDGGKKYLSFRAFRGIPVRSFGSHIHPNVLCRTAYGFFQYFLFLFSGIFKNLF